MSTEKYHLAPIHTAMPTPPIMTKRKKKRTPRLPLDALLGSQLPLSSVSITAALTRLILRKG